MQRLVVGCPVSAREWILPTWFDYTKKACAEAGLDPEFLFVVSTTDLPTLAVIQREADTSSVHLVLSDEPARADCRNWNAGRYDQMVVVRNALLGRVRELAPDIFWSLDSDILPAQTALTEALPQLAIFDAVGLHTYMSEPRYAPGPVRFEIGRELASKADLIGDRLVNRQVYESMTGTYPVDVIMATKLMTPAAYSIDYSAHHEGEDVGWSKTCANAGLRLAWCASALCKHVIEPWLLNREDPRVGF